MIEKIIDPSLSKSKGQLFLEYLLLAICLCVIALRVTLTESPVTQSSTSPTSLSDTVHRLSMSTVLTLLFVIWFVWALCRKKFLYRFTAIEIGLCLFTLSAVFAGLAAPNKRSAITNFVVLIAPLLSALLLVQILDSRSKIKLVLSVIVALGIVSAYQCTEQFFVGNQSMIEQYEQAPQTFLEPLGIKPGTFAQFLFEHRLYTRGIRGFFTTSNSAGSFALLASFAAIALFIENFKTRKSKPSTIWPLLASGIAAAIVIFGLVITRSKGAITASLLAAAMFITYLLFSNWLKAHKKAISILCLLAVVVGGCAVGLYGLTHGRLPGGSSMLVRWQYWHASAKMFADHSLTGVGPGNFVNFYPNYKPASALETVADPHNFLLSILTQYGPLGLVGFLAMIFIPLYKAASTTDSPAKLNQTQPSFAKLVVPFVIVISVALLLIRPMIMPVKTGETLAVMTYVIFTLYVAPAVAFAVGFWLLTTGEKTPQPTSTNITIAALFCAVVACLIHNLIDFAIFEPGVFTVLWAIIACLVASDFHQKSRPHLVLRPPLFIKITVVLIVLAIVTAYFTFAFLPAVKSSAKIQHAHHAVSDGWFQQAHNLLAAAAEDDRLSPIALSLNGRLYLQRYKTSKPGQTDLLLQAEKSLLAAIDRNKVDFKNFERLVDVYTLLAETTAEPQKTKWLNNALDSADRAARLYPGCARIHIELAQIAEHLNKTDIAIRHYKQAIEIEEAFRRQFRLMYPGREIFSRLGQQKYNFAKQKLKELPQQQTPK